MYVLNVITKKREEIVDITSKIREVLNKNNLADGVLCVFVPHTTAAVCINEGADFSVKVDVLSTLKKVFPIDKNYEHLEGNSDAHIKSILVGSSVNIVIENGNLLLGTWQAVYFCEFDGARNREVWLKFIESK